MHTLHVHKTNCFFACPLFLLLFIVIIQICDLTFTKALKLIILYSLLDKNCILTLLRCSDHAHAPHVHGTWYAIIAMRRRLGPSRSPIVSATVNRFSQHQRARSALRWGAVSSVAMLLILADM